MEVEQIYKYNDDDNWKSGLNIALIYEKSGGEKLDNRYIPSSFENPEKYSRVAVYVDCYTEIAGFSLKKQVSGSKRSKKYLML